MAKDPMVDAISQFIKKAPDKLKKEGKSLVEAANVKKSIAKKDKSFDSFIKKFLKALAVDKKKMSGDKAALKEIEKIEKIAKSDAKDRMKIGKVKGSLPS